jgi:molecular chaperone GrpE
MSMTKRMMFAQRVAVQSRLAAPRSLFHLPVAARSFHVSSRCLAEEKPAEPKAEEKKEEPKVEVKKEKTHDEIIVEKDLELKDLKNKYLTSLAEMQNLRTRTTNEVNNAKKFGGQEILKSVLEVADTLSMGLEHARPKVTADNKDLKDFFEGVEMTRSVLLQAFAKHGVTPMNALGAKFDPNLHDGQFVYADETKEPNTVGTVIKEGYMLKERVLRPAQVGTIKK